jgi:hypothetical protein
VLNHPLFYVRKISYNFYIPAFETKGDLYTNYVQICFFTMMVEDESVFRPLYTANLNSVLQEAYLSRNVFSANIRLFKAVEAEM